MLHNLPDVSSAGLFNVGQLAADNGFDLSAVYRFVIIVATGSGTVRVGDLNTSSSHGLPIVAASAGVQLTLPYFGQAQQVSLQSLNVYVPTGATVSIAWED